jgi:mono/diheme cytochrome c family protein
VGLVLVLVVAFCVISYVRQQRAYTLVIPALAIPSDSVTVQRGQHLVTAVGFCTDCHAADLGGKLMADQLLTGRLAAANLTSGVGGLGANYTDADLIRAIRHGVGKNGKSLIFMPAQAFQHMSDADLAAIIAYLRTLPPVNRTLPRPRLGPLFRVLHIVGFPLLPAELVDHHATADTLAPSVSVAYGAYLATVGGCTACHGPQLAGGGGPGPNITRGAIGAWTEVDFRHALREGRRPDGTKLLPPMPWPNFSHMTDDETAALWLFERSVPAVVPKAK